MDMKKGKIILIAAMWLAGLAGCIGSDALLGTVTLAQDVDADGLPIEESNRFTAGQTVTLAIEFKSVTEGLQAEVRWLRRNELLAQETLSAPRDADSLDPLWMSAKLPTDAAWPAGAYRCELFVPDQGTQTLEFELRH
jgi:hypothetical protein